MPEGPLPYVMFGDSFAIQCGIALMLAALASMAWLRRSTSQWAEEVTTMSRRILQVGFVLTLLASAAGMWLEAATMSEGTPEAAGAMVLSMLKDSHYGHAWLAGLAGLAIVGAAAWTNRAFGALLACLGVALFAYTRSIVSHAAEQGDMSARVVTDWIHLLLACLWVGLVVMGGFIALRRSPGTGSEGADAAAWVSSLSATATGALVVILLTGALKVWWAVPTFTQFVASAYARVLAIKLALVAVAVALGGLNRFLEMPPLLAALRGGGGSLEEARLRFVRVLRVEALVLFFVFVAASVLGGTAVPGDG